jgi:competence protein ComEC
VGEKRDTESSDRAFSFLKYNGRVDFIRRHPLVPVILLLAFVCLGIWLVALGQGRNSGKLTFAMLNIGQGDALFIEGPTGIQVLVDAGPNTGAVLRELPRVMRFGDRTIDAVIETHPDADHMGGFVDVLKRYKVGVYITPGIVSKTNTLIEALNKSVDAERALIFVARRGMVIDLGGGAHLDVLYPDADVSGYGEKTNDGSIVARLVYGETEVLLTGDAGFETEDHLLAIASSTLAADILKVGHHGSRSSTGEAFIQAVHPQMALVSVGAKNSYGHPTQETLDRLRFAGVPVMRTDQHGSIVCTSDAVVFTCK